MNQLKIAARTLLISIVALTGFTAVAAVTIWGSVSQTRNSAVQQLAVEKLTLTKDASTAFLNARRREKDFLLRLDEKYAAGQLQSTSREMTELAADSGQRAGSVATATEETTSNVQTVATATTELSASISEIAGQISNATSVAGETARQAHQTSSVIDELNQTVSRIGEIITLIRDIAEQTNLLALNATIESARAGEAGKGFAVVASEVKSLAGQTGRATEEIAAQIDAVQARTAGAVEAIKVTVDKVGEMEAITAAVAAAIEEQNAATQEISRNIEDASLAAEEVSQNVVHVSDAPQKTGRMAGEVLQASGNVSTQSDRLSERVHGFLGSVRAV